MKHLFVFHGGKSDCAGNLSLMGVHQFHCLSFMIKKIVKKNCSKYHLFSSFSNGEKQSAKIIGEDLGINYFSDTLFESVKGNNYEKRFYEIDCLINKFHKRSAVIFVAPVGIGHYPIYYARKKLNLEREILESVKYYEDCGSGLYLDIERREIYKLPRE